MIKKILIFMLLLAGTVFAHEEITVNIEEYMEDPSVLQDTANLYLSELPPIARFFIGDINVNVNFEGAEGAYVILQDGLIAAVGSGAVEDVDLDINLDENSIHEIADSENPANEVIGMINSGEITFEPHNIFTSLKISVARNFLR